MEPQPYTNGPAIRANTSESYRRAVERAILVMRERLAEPLSLKDLAEAAYISPYHFDRVFRQMTGVPPCRFLSALRIQEAKRLLLTTHLRVTDICFEVGYNSLGTFLTRFTELVGVTPRRLRRQTRSKGDMILGRLRNLWEVLPSHSDDGVGIRGMISAPDTFSGVIFAGLFPTPIPRSEPVSCSVLAAPGPYHMPAPRDGVYYLLAAGFPWIEGSVEAFLTGDTGLCVGSASDPVEVKEGRIEGATDLALRQMRPTDPPILMIPPLLFGSWLDRYQKTAAGPQGRSRQKQLKRAGSGI